MHASPAASGPTGATPARRGHAHAAAGASPRVGLFVPCYVDALFPQAAVATLELLEKLGCAVEYPLEQTCCGQPMANSGHQRPAAGAEARFAASFAGMDWVVGPSGSCVHHVRTSLDAIEQTAVVRRVRERTHELVDFLHDVLEVDGLPWASFPHRVALHDSCTALRGLGLGSTSEHPTLPRFSKSEDLLRKVAGVELVALDRPDECCGFGGSFCVTEPAVSARMGRDKVDDQRRHGAQYVVSGDVSCLLHQRGIAERRGAPLRYAHIAQVLNGGPL